MPKRFTMSLALMIAITACGGDDAAVTTTIDTTATSVASESVIYTSSDGTATVEVAGSAPEITIEAVDAADLGLPDDLATYGAYDLGPDGFSDGAVVTVATGLEWGDALPVVVGLLGTDDGRWEVLQTAAVGSVEGELTIGFRVPHFSPLVLIGSPFALDIDPYDVFASVGEHWDGFWDLVDPGVERVINGPAMRGFFYDLDADLNLFGSVRPLLDGVSVVVTARSDGAVSVVPGQSEVGSYGYEPLDGFVLGAPAGPVTEVFYGFDTFTCVSPGGGFYGFTVDLDVERSDLLIGARFRDRIALVRPADGVQVRYDIAGRAVCEEHPYVPLARFLQGYRALSAGQTASVLRGLSEDLGNGVYSISGVAPGWFRPSVDLWDHTGLRLEEPTQLRLDLDFNYSEFECGVTRPAEHLNSLAVTTVCATDATPIEAGDIVLVAATFMGALPVDAPEYYTYAAVFESNGDPADDWQYHGDFDWDFYQGADRWYQVMWDPDVGEWSMSVTDRLDPGGPTGARALLFGDTIVWIIPATEFAIELPAYRVTSFVHDGTFAPEVSGGDVSGTDPTEPPIPVTDFDS